MSKTDFDFNKALEQLKAAKGRTVKDGVFTALFKQLTEATLKAELDQHHAQDEYLVKPEFSSHLLSMQ